MEEELLEARAVGQRQIAWRRLLRELFDGGEEALQHAGNDSGARMLLGSVPASFFSAIAVDSAVMYAAEPDSARVNAQAFSRSAAAMLIAVSSTLQSSSAAR